MSLLIIHVVLIIVCGIVFVISTFASGIFVTKIGKDIEQSLFSAIAKQIGQNRFEMWLGNSASIECCKQTVTLIVQNVFVASWVTKNFSKEICAAFYSLFSKNHTIEIVSFDQKEDAASCKYQLNSGYVETKTANDENLFVQKPQISNGRYTQKQHQSFSESLVEPQELENVSSLNRQQNISRNITLQKKKHAITQVGTTTVVVTPGTKKKVLKTPRVTVVHKKVSQKSESVQHTSQVISPTQMAVPDSLQCVVLPVSTNLRGGNQFGNTISTSDVSCELEITLPLTPRKGNNVLESRRPPIPEKNVVFKTATTNIGTQITPQGVAKKIVAEAKEKLATIPGQRFFAGLEIEASGISPKRAQRNAHAIQNDNQSMVSLTRDSAKRNIVTPVEKNKSSVMTQLPCLDNFVVGPSNRLAVHTAELAVHHSGKISPIYIFGSTSVGKTHLLESIKNQLRRNPRVTPPLMMTAEQFTSAFIDGLKQGMPLFRNKFRGISTLLIDDIQFFAGKDSTQTEFLRTLDQLKRQGVQIVLSGDRSIGALAEILKSEIVTRLEAGMHCEIKPAEYETLLAIFRQMAASRNITLSNEICEYVVSHLTTHARQLSGALNRLHATILATRRPLTLESAAMILEDLIRNNHRQVKLQDIEKAVCETFQLGSSTLQSKSRAKQITQPRMLAMWLARKHTRSALSEIGKYFGNRSHSTVISAQKKVDQWLEETDIEMFDSTMSITTAIQKIERLLI